MVHTRFFMTLQPVWLAPVGSAGHSKKQETVATVFMAVATCCSPKLIFFHTLSASFGKAAEVCEQVGSSQNGLISLQNI